jgi:PKD repeat protein
MNTIWTKPFPKGLYSLLLGAVVMCSCGGGDDSAPKPTAAFEYEADGLEVTFINKSTNATTYSWDFGDGETSTEQNPVHEYEAYGVYTVKLSVTGEGGSAQSLPDELTIAKSSPVVIDGTFTDWADVPVASASVDGNGGTMQELKIDYDANKVYVLITGTMKGVYGVFINSDYNGATGATTPNFDYLWANLGADYYIEGNLVDWGSLQKDDPNEADWKFDVVGESSAFVSAKVGTIGDKQALEFSFLRSGIPNMSAEKIGIGIKDIDIDAGWTTSGALPPLTTEGVPGVYYTLDLTK